MRVLIVDDERIARSELKYCIRTVEPNAAVFEADGADSALELILNTELDGLFLDVQLTESSGIDLARHVREHKPELPIVFATAYEKYALDAFELEATDYILKPFSEAGVARALKRFTKTQTPIPACPNNRLTVWMGEKAVVLPVHEIRYITILDRETTLFTPRGPLCTNQSLDALEKQLAECGFMRIQRAYIVNLNHVAEIVPWINTGYALKLEGIKGDPIPISRNKLPQLREIFRF